MKKVISKKGVRLFNMIEIQNWQKFNYKLYLYAVFLLRYFFEWKDFTGCYCGKKRDDLLAKYKKNTQRMTFSRMLSKQEEKASFV